MRQPHSVWVAYLFSEKKRAKTLNRNINAWAGRGKGRWRGDGILRTKSVVLLLWCLTKPVSVLGFNTGFCLLACLGAEEEWQAHAHL